MVFALVLLGILTAKVSSRLSDLPEKRPTKQGQPVQTSQARLAQNYGKLPLSFELNKGQTDSQVKFLSRGRGYTMFLTGNEAVLALRKLSAVSPQLSAFPISRFNRRGQSAVTQGSLSSLAAFAGFSEPLARGAGHLRIYSEEPQGQRADPALQERSQTPNPAPPAPAVLRLKVLGANPDPEVMGLDPLPGKSNYFIGNDPKKWRTNVPTYAKVKYKDIYPGIDLVYYGNQSGRLEHDFIVQPGADPKAIRLGLVGEGSALPQAAEGRPYINPSGDLVIPAESGDVRLRKPVVYQPSPSLESRVSSPRSFNPKSQIGNQKSVEGRFVLKAKGQVGFEVAAYDKTRPLVIDPVLVYSTYLGGSGRDGAVSSSSIAVNNSGNAYVTGSTDSTDFPTMNPLQTANASGSDVFVAKLNAAGSGLLYSTYLGGTCGVVGQDQVGLSIAVDVADNAYVSGYTPCTDFPTVNPIQGTYGGGIVDGFVAKLDAAGSFVYSTYLGGSGQDTADSITADSSGNAYVAGRTNSSNFPTANPLQPSFGGGSDFGDGFVAKLSPTGTALIYSTYLGGSADDAGQGIKVDTSGNAYVSGFTDSANFPKVNPVQPTFGGVEDCFVAKLNAAGSTLVYSTYLGGDGGDRCYGIDLDSTGNAYVTGSTGSGNFPTTAGAFQTTYAGAFVTKLNSAGSALLYSTYLGGSGDDAGGGIAVDPVGNAHVMGQTSSTDFPTVSPIQATSGGGFDAFVATLNGAGSGLLFSTYVGGSDTDVGNGIALDSLGTAYVDGYTASDNFPTTAGAFQTSFGGGGRDAFVAKIGEPNTPAGNNVAVQPTDSTTATAPVALTFETVTAAGTTSLATVAAGPAPPSGFSLGDPPTYYDLSTTATFTGSVTVCISYSGVSFIDQSQLRLFHFESGAWVDRTVSLDTANKIICGAVTSLSPFAVVMPAPVAHAQPPVNGDASSVFKASRGVVPVKFTLTWAGVATCSLPTATIAVFRLSNNTITSVNENDYILASDKGSNFRVSDCQYVYNLATSSLGAGTYRVNILVGGNAVGSATFGLK
jgi:hypothetical protein